MAPERDGSRIARYAAAVVAGAAVTLVVLFVMQALIATARRELDRRGSRHIVDFVRVERSEAVQRKERKMEKPSKPEAPPEVAPPAAESVEPVEVAVNVAPPPVRQEISVSGLDMTVSDGEYLPIVKIAPTYPMRARDRGIEGYCIVEYTVTATGTVKDPVVIESEPTGIFDKVSVEAALKFKYKPRVVNGEPIAVQGVRNIFRYTLEN
jgi:protein TonB